MDQGYEVKQKEPGCSGKLKFNTGCAYCKTMEIKVSLPYYTIV